MSEVHTVSIIIPCFNGEQYLEQTLLSCLNQTYRDIEIILIDDGSTDASLRIAQRLASQHSTLRVFHTENSGQCAARNTGMNYAQGRYVKFLDSDDLLLPSTIENEVQLISSFHADMAIVGSVGFVDDQQEEFEQRYLGQSIDLSEAIHYSPFLQCIKEHPTSYNPILVNLEMVREVGGFDPSLKAAEEKNLHLRLAARYPEFKAVSHPEKLLLKRLREDALSRQAASQRETPHVLFSLQNAAEYFFKIKCQDMELKSYIFDQLYVSMTYAFRNHQQEYLKTTYPIWQEAQLPSANLTPRWHLLLHRIMGFWKAEQCLKLARKSKYFLRKMLARQ